MKRASGETGGNDKTDDSLDGRQGQQANKSSMSAGSDDGSIIAGKTVPAISEPGRIFSTTTCGIF